MEQGDMRYDSSDEESSIDIDEERAAALYAIHSTYVDSDEELYDRSRTILDELNNSRDFCLEAVSANPNTIILIPTKFLADPAMFTSYFTTLEYVDLARLIDLFTDGTALMRKSPVSLVMNHIQNFLVHVDRQCAAVLEQRTIQRLVKDSSSTLSRFNLDPETTWAFKNSIDSCLGVPHPRERQILFSIQRDEDFKDILRDGSIPQDCEYWRHAMIASSFS